MPRVVGYGAHRLAARFRQPRPDEIEPAIKRGATGVTTNPVLTYRAFQSQPDFWNPKGLALGDGMDFEPRAEALLKLQAIGAMDALLSAGKRIPQDVCITGYGGLELAQYLRVPLTTVDQPLHEIGRQGIEILLDRIKYRDMPVRKIVLKSRLVCRESTMRRKPHV